MTGREKALAWREAARLLEEAAVSRVRALTPEAARHIREVISPSLRRRAEIIERKARA